MPLLEGQTLENVTWEYKLGTPRLDVQFDFRTLPEDTFSRLVGVDGRYIGRLRSFPGFQVTSGDNILTDADNGSVVVSFGGQAGFKFIQPFSIQQSNSGKNVIRGLLFL